MKYLMTIDAGTGSIRAVLFDTNGNQIAISQYEWTHLSEDGVSNSMNFDCVKNWELVKSCITDVMISSKINKDDLLAITASSMREGIILYDKDGNELWAVANVDARADKEVKYLKTNFKGIEEKFYAESGQTFALGALPRILWVKNNRPDIYEKTDRISMISDWILAKLSKKIVSEPSNAGTSGIFSLKDREWSSSMAKKVGIKDDIFPLIFESGECIGTVNADIALELNLSKNTKIVMGGGDVQLGSIGLGVVNIGDCAIIGGSFWQQIVNIDKHTKPPTDMSIRVNPHLIENQSQAEGITFFSGLVMRWFRDVFCNEEKIKAKKTGTDAYTLMEQQAKNIPIGSNGIIPIFSDSMKYGKWYHASPSFLNLSIDPNVCNKASMFRSLEENFAIVSAINLEKIEKFTNTKVQEIIFAGGASKGELWSQILADVTNKKVKIPIIREATALGGAIVAGVGAGVYASMQDGASKVVAFEKEYIPNLANHKQYKKIRKTWEKAYKQQLKLVDKNITKSMWKAPGL